jgi:nitroreductase
MKSALLQLGITMLDILQSRRSIRKYRGKKIEREIVDQLKEAALRSPTSRGFNSWRFLFVDDEKILKKLSLAKDSGSSFLSGAALCVVVCGEENESDVWIEDCSIASIILQLTGQSLGLGSCWIQIRRRLHSSGKSSEEYVKEVLDLPESLRVESIIAFGYPDESKSPIPRDQLEYSKIL